MSCLRRIQRNRKRNSARSSVTTSVFVLTFPLTNVHPHAEHAGEAAEGSRTGSFLADARNVVANQGALDDESLAEFAVALGLKRKRLIQEVISGAQLSTFHEDFQRAEWRRSKRRAIFLHQWSTL